MNRKPLSYDKLLYYLENDDSDLDCLSEDDNGWEEDDYQEKGLNKIDVCNAVSMSILCMFFLVTHIEFDDTDFAVCDDLLAGYHEEETVLNQELDSIASACDEAELQGAVARSVMQELKQTDVEMGESHNEMENHQRVEKTSKTERIKLYYVENELTHKKDIVWRKNVQYLTPNIKWYHPIKAPIIELASPLYFFQQYFTDELLEIMVYNTNLYAVQQHAKFIPTCKAELETFIGLHILMGNLSYPRVRCYWENKLRIPMIADAMSRDRFFKLRKHLHFVNVQEKPPENTDRLWKVRPLYDVIRNRMLELTLENALCVDEQMIPFKGQLNIKQYVKNKPSPWGIKLFALCGTSGIMYDFLIYQGSTTELNHDQQEVFGLAASVVLKLAERINEKNIQLYFDNFFSNYNLLQYLRQRQIYATCTARIDRFKTPPFSTDSEMRKLGRGAAEEVMSNDGEVMLTKWFDNKAVVMASNFMSIGSTDMCKRWDKNSKEYVNIPRPEVIRNYNVNMGGVDKMDFLITIYRTRIRSRKWTLRMFTHAIDLASTNGWLEYKAKALALGIPKKDIMDLLHFRAYVAEALIGTNQNPTEKRRGRPSNSSQADSPSATKKITNPEIRPVNEVRLDGLHHLPTFDDKSFASRCKFFECKSRTHIMCQKCNVHLCIAKKQNCFTLYHTQK